MQDPMLRRHYRFSGNVQGVGFRYRASHAAQLLGLTGWVANCWDGTVEMEAQGTAEALARMLSLIDSGRFVCITDMDVRELPVDPEERGFHVRG